AKSNLRDLDRSLREAQRRHHDVNAARDEWPEMFDALSARIGTVRPRVLALSSDVQTALVRQEGFLRDTAVAELEAQRARIETYRVQARFALASIYDRSAGNRQLPRA